MAKVLEDILIDTVCFLYNKKLEDDLGIPSNEIEAKTKFAISTVCHIREAAEDGEILEDRCMVYFKSGDTMLVGMPYKKLSPVYDKYYSEK